MALGISVLWIVRVWTWKQISTGDLYTALALALIFFVAALLTFFAHGNAWWRARNALPTGSRISGLRRSAGRGRARCFAAYAPLLRKRKARVRRGKAPAPQSTLVAIQLRHCSNGFERARQYETLQDFACARRVGTMLSTVSCSSGPVGANSAMISRRNFAKAVVVFTPLSTDMDRASRAAAYRAAKEEPEKSLEACTNWSKLAKLQRSMVCRKS
jgi:hypothetical protein